MPKKRKTKQESRRAAQAGRKPSGAIARSAAGRPQSVRKSATLAKVPELSLSERVEQVLIGGDLSPLTPQERVDYYRKVCESLGLNWLTQPFTYILFREG